MSRTADQGQLALSAWTLARSAEVELRRTAPSAVVGDDRHFAVAVADVDGGVLTISRPSLVGTVDRVVKGILEVVGPVAPGLVAITNDPAVGAAHIHDFTIVTPIGEERIGGYAVASFHTADFGGAALGGFNPQAVEVWAEGAVIPPILLGAMGSEPDLLAALSYNTRLPDLFRGDLAAAVIAVEHVRTKAEPLLAPLAAAVADTGAQVATMLEAVPAGTWTQTATLHHCCTGVHVDITARLSLADGRATIDFAGSGAAVAGFVNSSLGNTCFAATLPFVDALAPHAVNAGLIDRIAVTAPQDSVVCAPATAATAWGPYGTAAVIADLVSRLMLDAGLQPRPTRHWTLAPRPRFHVQACDDPGCAFDNRTGAAAPEPRHPSRY